MQQLSQHLEITLPDALYQWLLNEAKRNAQDVSTVVQAALEQYAQPYDLTKTRTWELCGAFTVVEPEAAYIVNSNQDLPVTNYAEHVDEILCREA
jgi:metal-responsive CopG/Arc/MetJ family transcriptional regulator